MKIYFTTIAIQLKQRNKFLEDNKKRQYNMKNKSNMIRYVSMFFYVLELVISR